MPAPKLAKNLAGSNKADTLLGNRLDNTLQGKAGDDLLTGGDGNDVFKFEKSLAANGMDTITDYQWAEDVSSLGGVEQDVLDLTAALKSFKDALALNDKTDIGDYVLLDEGIGGMKLMVDQDGAGGKDPEQWAVLDGLTAGDQVRVRAFTGSAPDIGDGYFTIGGAPVSTHIFVLSESGYQLAYRDTNGDGLLGTGDALLGSSRDGAWAWDPAFSFGKGSYTLEYLGFALPLPQNEPVDLSGFGADDFLVFNFQTRKALTATTVSLAGYPDTNVVTANEILFGRLAKASGSGFGLTTSVTITFSKSAWYHSAARIGNAPTHYMRLGVNLSVLSNKIGASYALPTATGSISNGTRFVIGQWKEGTVTLTGTQITVSWP